MESQGRILIVDDEACILRTLTRALTLHGFNAATASNAEEALAHLAQAPPETIDVVLSDIHMPGRSGVQLLEAIHRHDPDLPVVLMTAVPAVDTALKAIEHGAARYLTKPIDLPHLFESLAHGVNLRKLARLKREAVELLTREATGRAERAALDTHLTRALSAAWIAYQPIASLDRADLYAFEALVRSTDAALSTPTDLIQAATQLDRLHDLGRTVRTLVGARIATHVGPELFFVNLHPTDLLDPDLFRTDTVFGRNAKRIVLEITERMPLEGIPDLRARLTQLRALGYRLAVDDLGTGYSGLSSLTWIEPEILKIDMSLIRDIHTTPTKQHLAGSMLTLARAMGILAVVEGVETAAERDTLVALGADLVQGYLFGHPDSALRPPCWSQPTSSLIPAPGPASAPRAEAPFTSAGLTPEPQAAAQSEYPPPPAPTPSDPPA